MELAPLDPRLFDALLDAYDADMEIAYRHPSGESGQKPLKAIEKDLRELIANWRRQDIALSKDSIELGTLGSII